MHRPMLHLPRFKSFALAALAAPALMLTQPARAMYGASLLLTSTHGEAYTCRATVLSRHDDQLVARSDYLRVDWWGALFSFGGDGVLPVAANGDTPRFGWLGLTCWAASHDPAGVHPPAGTPSYTVWLNHQDPAWQAPSPDGHGFVRTLPRDDRTLQLQIRRTADPARMFQISQAWLRLWQFPSDEDVKYSSLIHRHLELD